MMSRCWRWVLCAGLTALALLCVAARAEAEGERLPPQGPLVKVGRGVWNILLSPIEIPATMRRVAYEQDAFTGLWAGGLEGVGNGLMRLSAGVMEVATAPIPGATIPLYTKRLGERATPPLDVPYDLTKP